MKTDAPHYHYGGEELFCAYENSRFGFYTATTVLHRKGALFNFAYTLAPYQHDYYELLHGAYSDHRPQRFQKSGG